MTPAPEPRMPDPAPAASTLTLRLFIEVDPPRRHAVIRVGIDLGGQAWPSWQYDPVKLVLTLDSPSARGVLAASALSDRERCALVFVREAARWGSPLVMAALLEQLPGMVPCLDAGGAPVTADDLASTVEVLRALAILH